MNITPISNDPKWWLRPCLINLLNKLMKAKAIRSERSKEIILSAINATKLMELPLPAETILALAASNNGLDYSLELGEKIKQLRHSGEIVVSMIHRDYLLSSSGLAKKEQDRVRRVHAIIVLALCDKK